MNYFKTIALCFSGGGYRAATFSLGALSLFEKVGILEDVKALSTVSGGTITGVKYAQSQIERQSFDDFFSEYYQWLQKNELTKNAISHLKSNNVWKKPENIHKRINPINAFSIEYNTFTNHRTLGEIQELIYESSKNSNKVDKRYTHLRRVIFNATDFSTNKQFRFQNIKGNRKWFGNKDAHSNYKHLINKLKLGDILAASSAFPGGFEPIGIPNDFVGKDANTPESGLMDGGIVDNQGSSVFLLKKPGDNASEAEKEKFLKKKYGLYFACDVASPYPEKPFSFSSDSSLNWYIKILSSWITFVVVIGLTIFLFFKKWTCLYSIGLILSTLLICLQLCFLYASKKAKELTDVQESLILPPNRVGNYLINRIKSLLRMAGEVFLKNDRSQHATNLYANFPNSAVTSTIYELRCKNDKKIPENVSDWEDIKKHTGDIPKVMKDISSKSASFGTTLWFSKANEKDHLLDQLIACGEYTACFNLISHLVRKHSDKIGGEDIEATALFKKLIFLWNEFKENPQFLVHERIEKLKR